MLPILQCPVAAVPLCTPVSGIRGQIGAGYVGSDKNQPFEWWVGFFLTWKSSEPRFVGRKKKKKDPCGGGLTSAFSSRVLGF